MIPWEKYLSEFVDSCRNLHQTITPDLVRAFHKKLSTSFMKPCQVEVVELGQNRSIWFIIYDKNHEDKEFFVSKISKSDVESFAKSLTKKYPSLKRKKTKISKYLEETIGGEDIASKRLHEDICGGLGAIYSNYDIRVIPPILRARDIFEFGLKKAKETIEKEKLKKTTKKLERQIAKVSEEDIRSELFKTLNRLDEQQDALSTVSEEIEGVRKLVGTTKEFQDWKLLVSDVRRLKEENISRKVFDAKVNELSTRIDSLSEIREAYDQVLAQQTKVIEQQSSFIKWIKYATILLPIAVISVPVIEIISTLIRHSLGIL